MTNLEGVELLESCLAMWQLLEDEGRLPYRRIINEMETTASGLYTGQGLHHYGTFITITREEARVVNRWSYGGGGTDVFARESLSSETERLIVLFSALEGAIHRAPDLFGDAPNIEYC